MFDRLLFWEQALDGLVRGWTFWSGVLLFAVLGGVSFWLSAPGSFGVPFVLLPFALMFPLIVWMTMSLYLVWSSQRWRDIILDERGLGEFSGHFARCFSPYGRFVFGTYFGFSVSAVLAGEA